MRLAPILPLVWAIGTAPPAALAQQAVDLASVSGRVTDPSGAVVPEAQVTARQTQTNVTTTTTTDQEGRFRLPYLHVGPYQIAVHRSGFQDAVRNLAVSAGAAFELPVTLSISAVDTTVTVTADTTVLQAARTQIAATISEAEVRTLPMNGRNFLELALLVPGVSPTNVASTQLFPETSAIMTALREVIRAQGLPMALYTDRAHWAFHTPQAKGPVDKTQLTQLGALARLGIEHIPAYSPQARGRSERLNRTLQDRLVNELRVAKVTTVVAANRYLRDRFIADYNASFSCAAADPAPAFVDVAISSRSTVTRRSEWSDATTRWPSTDGRFN